MSRTLSRRKLVVGAVLSMALAACCETTPYLTCAQDYGVVIKTFADSFKAAAPQWTTDKALLTKIGTVVDEIDASFVVVSQLTVDHPNDAAGIEFVNTLNAFVSLTAEIPSPPMPADVHTGALAVAYMLPTIEKIFNAPPSPPTDTHVALMALPPTTTGATYRGKKFEIPSALTDEAKTNVFSRAEAVEKVKSATATLHK